MQNLLTAIVSRPLGAFVILAIAAFLETFGDSCFQSGLYRASGPTRLLWLIAGAAVLSSYGLTVNIPRWDFGKLLGVYVVLFFLAAQLLNKVRFDQPVTLPIAVGGAFIVTGGLIITFWTR